MNRNPERIDRRNLFFSAGAVAAGALLLEESIAQADNPAANVGDRLTSLKITALKATRVGTKAYFKIETNHGIIGWGEVTGSTRPSPARWPIRCSNCSMARIPRGSSTSGRGCTARTATSAAART